VGVVRIANVIRMQSCAHFGLRKLDGSSDLWKGCGPLKFTLVDHMNIVKMRSLCEESRITQCKNGGLKGRERSTYTRGLKRRALACAPDYYTVHIVLSV